MANNSTISTYSRPFPWQQDNWARLCSQLKQQRLAHAYLLCGEQGLGKQHFALAAARVLLCRNPNDNGACESCSECKMSWDGNHPDLLHIEPEEGTRVLKVDQVRALTEFTDQTSHSALRKVVIIKQADLLNISAANALLKTLEEPAGNTVLLLLSDKPGGLLATIRSRCQRIVFTTPSADLALAWLKERIPPDKSDDIVEVLELAAGKPLKAQELALSGKLEERQAILQALTQVAEGVLDPVAFAATYKSLEVTEVIDCLSQLSALLTKFLLSKDRPELATTEIQSMLTLLGRSNRSEDETLGRLLQLNQAALEARRQLDSVSNPNPQLIFESMMWRWSRIGT